MNRILVIGCPGSGKTTFSNELAEILDLPLVHLDQLFWQGDWQQVARDAFDLALQQELEKPQWIIDGNYARTLDRRLDFADLVIWLDLPTSVCLWRVIKRFAQNRGRAREDMGGNCVERWDKEHWDFFCYVLTFRKKQQKEMLAVLQRHGEVPLKRMTSRRQIRTFLQQEQQNRGCMDIHST